jgi:lysosomal acid lipase/cholesteryl ester hydrolase
MPRIPFIGRLFWREYLALVLSILLVFLEGIAHVVAFALPGPILQLLYRLTRKAFNFLSSPQGRRSRNKKKAVTSSIGQAADFVEICNLFGYYAEEHIVQTKDGYLLGLHRLGWRKGEEDVRVNAGPNSIKKKVVYLRMRTHHPNTRGLLPSMLTCYLRPRIDDE